jgi:holo-[acyl-carrier protein] synthase
MHIIGLGLDVTEIDRISAVLARHGDRFLARVFTSGEVAYCQRHRDPAPSLAARFATKEAAMKALGTGAARGVGWRDIEVVRHSGEAPQLRLHGGAARRFEQMGGRSSLMTITHAGNLAVAQVLLLGAPR